MKKVLSVFLAALIILAIIPSTVFAASTPKITASADKTAIKVGDTVTVTVKVAANSNLVSLGYSLKFDTSYFQVVSESSTLGGAFPYEMTNENITGEVRYMGATNGKVTAAKTLFTVKFKVLKTGGKITCNVSEAYVLSGGEDVNVTSSCASNSTKSISFTTSSTVDYLDIKKPSTTTIKYKNGIVLHLDQKTAFPAGSKIKWTCNNGNFKVEQAADGKSCTIISDASGESVITVKLVNSAGTVLDSAQVTMTSKAGFFDKIIAFFRSIFGGPEIKPN